MTAPTRRYTNGEIVVEWYPERCVHCQARIQGLSQVFNLDAKPWVNIQGAYSADIIEQVLKCPSAALQIGEDQ